jgi:hypothetical protein
MHAVAARPSEARRTPTVVRMLELIRRHGSQTAALEALLHQADELERLKRALRAMGMTPEFIASELRVERD